MAPGGRLAKEFHLMPQTFVLPHQFTVFVTAFASSGIHRGVHVFVTVNLRTANF